MNRRDLIAAAIGLASCGSFGARAQLAQRMRRIGLLLPVEQRDLESQLHVAAFRQQFQQLGWTEGRNAQLDVRWATDEASQISNFATELVSLQPDAILARSTPVTAALLRATSAIPIVFVNVADPVGAGFVASMARPGRNATGFTNVEPTLGGKMGPGAQGAESKHHPTCSHVQPQDGSGGWRILFPVSRGCSAIHRRRNSPNAGGERCGN